MIQQFCVNIVVIVEVEALLLTLENSILTNWAIFIHWWRKIPFPVKHIIIVFYNQGKTMSFHNERSMIYSFFIEVMSGTFLLSEFKYSAPDCYASPTGIWVQSMASSEAKPVQCIWTVLIQRFLFLYFRFSKRQLMHFLVTKGIEMTLRKTREECRLETLWIIVGLIQLPFVFYVITHWTFVFFGPIRKKKTKHPWSCRIFSVHPSRNCCTVQNEWFLLYKLLADYSNLHQQSVII